LSEETDGSNSAKIDSHYGNENDRILVLKQNTANSYLGGFITLVPKPAEVLV